MGETEGRDRFRVRRWNPDTQHMEYDLQDVELRYLHNTKQNEVLMQCTGVKDKTGTLIWEGDIVKLTIEEAGKVKEMMGHYAVIYYAPAFVYAREKEAKYRLMFEWGQKAEFVGNIYENPELLEVDLSLEACPFCGCKEVRIIKINDDAFYAECILCLVRSKEYKSKQEVKDLWNRRNSQ